MEAELKKQIIQNLMSRDILVTEEILERLDKIGNVSDKNVIEKLRDNNELILDDDFYNDISKKISVGRDFEWNVTELPKRKEEKKEEKITEESNEDDESPVHVVYNYKGFPKKRNVFDFSQLFKKRYYSILNILRGRKELQNLVSISRLYSKNEKESVAFVGMVSDKSETAKGNVMLTLEDDTGIIKVVVTSYNEEVFNIAKDIVLDEVIGVTGIAGNKIVFANNILFPDVPLSKELKKSPLDEYAVFISDLHFGSTYFLKKEWNKFVKWLNGELGSETHKEISKKIKYLIIAGDLIEGVGIYPGQENDLEVSELSAQYNLFLEELKKFPKDLNIIIIPGNHDAVRVADPQPPISERYVPELYKMKNVYMLSSPSTVRIGRTGKFPGIELCLYHGYSYPYYAENIPSIRDNGGMIRADLVLKFYLQRRHLGITHNALQYVPDSHDALFISEVPDVLVTGHVHRTMADTYRNVTILNCSTWVGMTDYQEKVGLEPEPARAILMSLKTRAIKIINFSEKKEENKDDDKKEESNKEENND